MGICHDHGTSTFAHNGYFLFCISARVEKVCFTTHSPATLEALLIWFSECHGKSCNIWIYLDDFGNDEIQKDEHTKSIKESSSRNFNPSEKVQVHQGFPSKTCIRNLLSLSRALLFPSSWWAGLTYKMCVWTWRIDTSKMVNKTYQTSSLS